MNNKLYNGIMGLVVADAMGVPYEFRERGSFTATEMRGYGTYNQAPGTWSDDSSMTLATMAALIESKGKIDLSSLRSIMNNFIDWLYNGNFTPDGTAFDVGRTTRTAIERYIAYKSLDDCGCVNIHDNGNGALMRMLPLAFVNTTFSDIEKVAGLTHKHNISQQACLMYVDIVSNVCVGVPLDKAIKNIASYFENSAFDLNRIKNLKHLTRNEMKSSGYVVDTLETALWCVLKTDNYKDCVLTAVNLGGDTDTIAAVAGGLAGIIYGTGTEKGIPDEWINQIKRKDYITELCSRFSEFARFSKE